MNFWQSPEGMLISGVFVIVVIALFVALVAWRDPPPPSEEDEYTNPDNW